MSPTTSFSPKRPTRSTTDSFRVARFEGGYARRIPLGAFELALGGTLATYAKPRILDAAYGRAPVSGTLFARLSLGQ